ncbi:hypothetical protein V5F29_05390 [Xanthobacter aminoxidans]|uniref:hypothetical protein n=1 Tax=Xanthobacter aminoxidans TaxID=186280 RepID=UPI003729A6B7
MTSEFGTDMFHLPGQVPLAKLVLLGYDQAIPEKLTVWPGFAGDTPPCWMAGMPHHYVFNRLRDGGISVAKNELCLSRRLETSASITADRAFGWTHCRAWCRFA